MSKKLAAVCITLFLLLGTYGALFTYFSFNNQAMPLAVNGTLDLSQWRFEEDGVIELDGEWELYPGELLSKQDFEGQQSPYGLTPIFVEVPGTWSEHIDPIGLATYRLRVFLNEADVVYGLKTSSIPISNRIIINNEVVGDSGNPAEKQQYKAINKPYVSYFTMNPGWNEILVQVANFEFFASSGLIESLILGESDQITSIHGKAVAYDWITLTAFLIMGLYFLGLFSQRRSDYPLLVLGLICICIAIFTSVSGERLLYDMVGSIPFWLFFRIQMVSVVGIGIGFFFYVYTAFRDYCWKWFIHGSLAIGIIVVLLHIGFANTLSNELFRQFTSLYVTFSLLYATYVFVFAALHRVAGSRYLAVAAMALNSLALSQNLNFYFGVPIYSLPPIEPFMVLLMLALLMSLRFSNAFRTIEKMSEQLLQADKLKDDFLARTSHEFKTPLHGIMNISRSMLDDTESMPTAKQREKLQLITDITGQLSQLVYDILDMSKMKRGELRIEPSPVDIRSIAEVQVRFYAYLLAERRIALKNQISVNLPLAWADENRVSQVIGILLDNAIKYTQSGSIIISGLERENRVEVSIQDTGKGIDPQDIPIVFDPYKTFNNAERRGFGLGLPIAKQLIDLHNGTLSVVSTPGMGSVFTFTLPIADPRVGEKVTNNHVHVSAQRKEYSFVTPFHTNRGGKHTVLIVDDQFVNLKVLLDSLQTCNYYIIAVKDGYEAMKIVRQVSKIDLVILDLMMPGMSGYEVCQEIRKRYSLIELPVLMVTAAIQPQDKVKAFQAGANDYLPKPFDVDELKVRVNSLLTMKESLSRSIHMEVAFLQSQIKPHFLFNVLNSIVASSYTNIERSRKMITDLAEYLRGSFRFSNADQRITFTDEFSLIQTYVNIERVRFKNRIRFEYDIPEEVYHLPMPPLLLQPLIENAIRHGIGDRMDGGSVMLTAEKQEGQWTFIITDDGVGISADRLVKILDKDESKLSQGGVGLLNINQRLKFEYGSEMIIESELGSGTKVIVQIPDA